jgi:YbbR domain-containing protein
VVVQNVPDSFVVEGPLPGELRVTIRGPIDAVVEAEGKAEVVVIVDGATLGAGSHRVKIGSQNVSLTGPLEVAEVEPRSVALTLRPASPSAASSEVPE